MAPARHDQRKNRQYALVRDSPTILTAEHLADFEIFGFVVVRSLLTPSEVEQITAEVDAALRDVFADAYSSNTRRDTEEGDVAAEGNFLPLMADRAPLSQALVADDDRLSGIAGALLGDFTVASPALATCLVSDTPWHNDGGLGTRWLRCNAYLQPVTQATGALRFVPASQEPAVAGAIDTYLDQVGRDDPEVLPGVSVETEPGDVVVFDPRIHHGSWGGAARLRWSIDYLAMPATHDRDALASTASLIADLSDWPTTPDWPTWAQWRAHHTQRRQEAVRKLDALGVDLST